MSEVAEQTKQAIGLETVRVVTDKGYESREDILDCLRAGVLPRCYGRASIRVETQYRGAVSCFIRHEDGTVTCPMGRRIALTTTLASGSTPRAKSS